MNLNERQQEAVEATEGRVRVVAGAGSGKTRVLAHRYAFLVNDIGISPGNILCLTFTNKAAQEMKRRISTMVDRGSVNDFICTIHSFCAKFLRREIYRIGYPKNFTIIDEEDGKVLARQAMQEFGVDRRKTTAERFLKSVAALKGYEPTHYIQRHLLPHSSPEAPDATVRYLKLQLKQFALDYDDLLYFTLYILNHFDDARKYWTEKLNYVMVDEVQDCTGDDWKLLHAITQHHGNLFVVGDPDQAIYEWRGANPKIFVDFKAKTDIILNQNYRSTPDILDVANSIIDHNHNRVKKDLFTLRPNERKRVHVHSKSDKEEADFIAARFEV
ncbi:MAG: ATP-dependent helicase, partial [Muribaculaceae bacterium]|nr:ATP-dependent helicase [Muribaculaceae bacterium]